jgi:hypothetical protein
MSARLLAIVALSLLAACAQSTPSSTPEASTNTPRKDLAIQFDEENVRPSEGRVLQGGRVTWVNQAEDMSGAIAFPASIRSAFTCTELRPQLSETGEGYVSMPITPGMGEAFELPCPLKPGSYDYKVLLFNAGPGGNAGVGMYDPQLTMPAKLVVE